MKNKIINFLFFSKLGMFVFLMFFYSLIGLILIPYIPWKFFFIAFEIWGTCLGSIATIFLYRD